MALEVETEIESWPLDKPLRITGMTYTEIDVVVVTVRAGEFEGRGEAAGVDYLGESTESMVRQIAAASSLLAKGVTRAQLRSELGIGGARNALDCALWDLEAAQSRVAAWRTAGVAAPKPCLTTWTIGADDPESVGQRAASLTDARAIKLKLTGDGLDAERVRYARTARPDVWLCVDGNQGFTRASLEALLPTLLAAGVALIEQPLPMNGDTELDTLHSPIPLAADESVQGLASIAQLSSGYSTINIKLDKCGGLTEALMMADAARTRGMGVMVGNMLGTSLAMAPAFVLGQFCDVVDLDGPLLLARDRLPSAAYRDGLIWCPEILWGGASDVDERSFAEEAQRDWRT